MSKLYDLLENVLIDIEKGLNEGINTEILAGKYGLSDRHLRRLFRFSFKQTLGEYIRARKLSASLVDLLETDFNVLDIAIEYGFEYESTFIRSFKREFRITPGDLRKCKTIVKVKPPLHLFDENKLDDGLLFGPDIVMVPKFHVVGKQYKIPLNEPLLAQKAAIDFWENERQKIQNAANPNVYIGLSRNLSDNENSIYLPSLQVNSINEIPDDLYSDTFDTSFCARFRYIGQHHFFEINRNTARSLYNAIQRFANTEQTKYALAFDKGYFEKVDTSLYNGEYCQMEWFAPVIKK